MAEPRSAVVPGVPAADPASETIGIEVHGVRVDLTRNNAELLEFVRSLARGSIRTPSGNPDLRVSAFWQTEPDATPDPPFGALEGLDSFGRRMHLGDDRLVWLGTHRDESLRLQFRRVAGRPAFDVAYHYAPKAKKLERHPDYRQRVFFDLFRYTVLFPIAWHLERTRGWSLLHASAVRSGERAVVIAGPGGTGKTTTCAGLVHEAGMVFFSENLLFTDGDRVFATLEPIRLTEESIALLGDDRGGLEPLDPAGANGRKSMFRSSRTTTAADPGLRPLAIFVPRLGREGALRRLSPGQARDVLDACQRLTLELGDYDDYAACLDLLWPDAERSGRRGAAIERLAAQVPVHVLRIDRAGGVRPVVERILDAIDTKPIRAGEPPQ